MIKAQNCGLLFLRPFDKKMKFILGKKLAMTQKFLPDGNVLAVTEVQAGPCTITQVKGGRDGYQAVQIGYGQTKNLLKALQGHLQGLPSHRYLREFRLETTDKLERGQVIDVSTFVAGDYLKVTGISKGKGFQGVVKRHHFAGSPASHGHKDQLRMPGSIGATEPQHVFKGTRMGGRMGGDQVSLKAEGELKVKAAPVQESVVSSQQPAASSPGTEVGSENSEAGSEKVEEVKEGVK